MPPHVTAKKAVDRLKRAVSEMFLRHKDGKVSSYLAEYPDGRLYSCFPKLSADHIFPQAETIAGVTKHYLDHRFDLLGSGWVQVKHGMRCRGLEGYRYDMGNSIQADSEGKWLEGRINSANLEESKRIWKLIFHDQPSDSPTPDSRLQSYIPIDWHLDFKSGYRWSESMWHKNIPFGHKPGVDVKVPWELARMQHLPQLAYAYALASFKFYVLSFKKEKKVADISQEEKTALDLLEPPERYVWEFRSQVLDFIAANPPRFGVNWACTMDVGIRVANWLVAYDMFMIYGAKFDIEFEKVFSRGVYEHGLHIINNLEWNEEHRGNHYLSDIAGLLFVAAYLPATAEIDAWLALAMQELINEVDGQFYPDGGNFEASTSYHRLSAEMTLYATAMVLALPEEKVNALRNYDHTLIKVKPGLKISLLSFYSLPIKKDSRLPTPDSRLTSPFSEWYFERLEKMAEFTIHITKPNNHIPQIGDNDSGRFFKFKPVFNKMTVAEAKKRYLNLEGYDDLPDDAIYWDEDFLDHRHLVAAINGLFDRDDFNSFTGSGWLETDLVRNLAGGIILSSYKKTGEPTAAEKVHIESANRWDELHSKLEAMPEDKKQAIDIPLPDGATDDLKLYAYPNFGLYIYRSRRLYLAIRCGSVGQNGKGGHAHNDQLSIELNIDGKDIIADPGTYLYTPFPERRNEYRSFKAHFAPQVKSSEPGSLDMGLFKLGDEAKAECLYFGKDAFTGIYLSQGAEVRRYVYLYENRLKILDMCNPKKGLELPMNYEFSLNTNGDFSFKNYFFLKRPYSHSYGKVSLLLS